MSIQQNFPAITPSLSLNFARSKTLDPRITFSRTTTGTYVDESGVIRTADADEPRFDHSYDPVSGSVRSLGLLVEESRSNSVRYSTIVGTVGTKPTGFQFASSIVGQSCEVSTDFDIDGNGNCIKHIRGESGDNNVGYPTNVGTLVSGTTYTFSVYVYIPLSQKNNITSIRFGPDNGFSSVTFGFADLNITDRWQRVIGSFVSNGGGGVLCRATASNGAFFYTDAWQLEAGAFPTSYIPTTTSEVTRTADNVSMVGENFSSWYNQNEGTFYVSSRFFADGEVGQRIFQIDNDTNTNINAITFRNELGSNQIRASDVDFSSSPAGFDLWTFTGSLANTEYKTAYAIKTNDYAAVTNFPNGRTTINTTTTRLLIEKTTLRIGFARNNASPLNGHISQLTYYPRRLTNAQLQNLTK